MPGKGFQIDTSIRQCEVCRAAFRITDYPPGWFAYKYEVRAGSAVNTCVVCEVDFLRRVIKDQLESPRWTIPQVQRKTEDYVLDRQHDVCLLLTGRLMNEKQRKNAHHIYGPLTWQEVASRVRFGLRLDS